MLLCCYKIHLNFDYGIRAAGDLPLCFKHTILDLPQIPRLN